MRQKKREVKIGNVTIGGNNPIAVQTMLNVPVEDIEGNVAQAKRCEAAGCQILRVTCPSAADAKCIEAVKNAVNIPIVADIHFDYKAALACADVGVDKIRINPGNIGDDDRVKAVVQACQQKNIPIRIGVNGGSLEKHILAKYGAPVPEAMVESALYHVRLLEKFDFNNIVISIKNSNVPRMMEAYRQLSAVTDYPLHVGVTEAGTYQMGLLKSGMGIGGMLLEGIGDTIRVSLAAEPEKEVEAGFIADAVTEEASVYTVFNSNSFVRKGGSVLLLGAAGNSAYLEDGTALKSQETEGGLLVEIPEVPAMGTAAVVLKKAPAAENTAFTVDGHKVETPFYLVEFNEAGQISRLYDKENDREVLAPGQCGNVLQVFEDKPMGNDAWDIEIYYQEKMRVIDGLTCFEVKECGSVRLVLHMGWKYMNSTIDQDVILYADDRRIDFVTDADCHERHQLLKAAFPVDIRTTYGTFDVQYGNVRRSNNWNTSWDQAKFESVAHRFADLSEYGYGVSLLNDCKYGHDVKDNVLRITLIKTATYPDHSQDQGEHHFTYALLPHTGDFIAGRTVQEASDLNWPMHSVAGSVKLPFAGSFVGFDKECVELDAVKKTEDGKYIAVRFHDFTGGTNKLTVTPGFAWKRYCECDLRERPQGDFKENGTIQRTVKPYEIVTLLFEV